VWRPFELDGDLLQTTRRVRRSDQGEQGGVGRAGSVGSRVGLLLGGNGRIGRSLSIDHSLILGEDRAPVRELLLLGGRQRELAVHGVIEVTDEVVELIHPEQRGD